MEGFSGVIFILVFLAFSILEGIGRKRKAQEQKERAEGTPLPPSRERRPARETPSADRSTASPVEGAGRAPVDAGRRGAGAGGGTSEGLIPKDVWEEILGLARGTAPAPKQPEPVTDRSGAPEPRPEAETLEEIPPFEARSLEPLYVEHQRASQRSKDVPVSTGTSAPESLTPGGRPGEGRGRGRGAAARGTGGAAMPLAAHRRRIGGGRLRRDLFGRGSPDDLRRAVVLSEVLGPPVAMRDQPGEGRKE